MKSNLILFLEKCTVLKKKNNSLFIYIIQLSSVRRCCAGQDRFPACSARLPGAVCQQGALKGNVAKIQWIHGGSLSPHVFNLPALCSTFILGMYRDAKAGFLPPDIASSYVPLCRHRQVLFRGNAERNIKVFFSFSLLSSTFHLRLGTAQCPPS